MVRSTFPNSSLSLIPKKKILTQTRYFVNLHTGKSQWERPEVPAEKEEQLHSPPDEPPPSYEDSGDLSSTPGDQKLSSNNPYNARGSHTPRNDDTVESDARLAARLQAEENARSTGSHAERQQQPGAATDYYQDSTGGSPAAAQQSSLAPEAAERGGRGRSRSFLSKLMGKASGGSSSSGGGYSGGYGGGYSGGYGRPPPGPPIQSSYGYPPGGGGFYGGYPAQTQMGYGYSPMGMGMGGMGGGGYPPRRQGGMGNAGAAALGVGGGLLGGALLADAFEDHGDTYVNNDYGDGGGDGGGGDDGGGGGDF